MKTTRYFAAGATFLLAAAFCLTPPAGGAPVKGPGKGPVKGPAPKRPTSMSFFSGFANGNKAVASAQLSFIDNKGKTVALPPAAGPVRLYIETAVGSQQFALAATDTPNASGHVSWTVMQGKRPAGQYRAYALYPGGAMYQPCNSNRQVTLTFANNPPKPKK